MNLQEIKQKLSGDEQASLDLLLEVPPLMEMANRLYGDYIEAAGETLDGFRAVILVAAAQLQFGSSQYAAFEILNFPGKQQFGETANVYHYVLCKLMANPLADELLRREIETL